MKTIATTLLFCMSFYAYAQVGVGTTNPDATLDIEASNVANPASNDGILIPRIDNFPSANPNANQDGMMVFATGNGTPTKGFYYWDNGASNWISVKGSDPDVDFYEIGTTSNPDQITDDIYTLGRLKIGQNSTATASLNIHDWNASNSNAFYVTRSLNSPSTSGQFSGAYITIDANTTDNYFGVQSVLSGSTQAESANFSAQAFGTFNSFTNLFSGRFYSTSGTGRLYGANVSFQSTVTNTGNKYGYNVNIPSSLSGTHYGLYADVQSAIGYAGYFIGRTSLGDGFGNRYLMPASDGTNGQVMTTDGAGIVTFQDVVGDGDTQNTLDQAYDEGGAGAGKNITADNGAVRINGTDGILITGTLGSGNTIDDEITGDGVRMFFNPNKAAYRGGMAENDWWIDSRIGNYSFSHGRQTWVAGEYSVAFGRETSANGEYAFATGYDSNAGGNRSFVQGFISDASGDYSVSFGNGNYARELHSLTIGSNNTSDGEYGTAIGSLNAANGDFSKAIGYNLNAESYGETVLGLYNTNYTENSSTAFDANDRLFVLGNGTSNILRSNALTIYKNGLMNINDAYNMPLADGTANQVMTTDGSGNLSFQSLPTGVERIDDLLDAKSDNDGTNDGSSIFLGINAGATDDSSDNQNIGIGFNAMTANFAGFGNVGIGYNVLPIANGWDNTAIGTNALDGLTTGFHNVALGAYTMPNLSTGSDNTIVGYRAGGNATNTSGNVFIGNLSGTFASGGNQLYIENSAANADNALIYGEFDNDILRTNGEFQIGNPTTTGYAFPTTDGTANQVMTTDGAGNLTFQDIIGDGIGNDWSLSGNNTLSTDFIGTINSRDLPFRSNNTEYLRLTTTGQLEILNTSESIKIGQYAGEGAGGGGISRNVFIGHEVARFQGTTSLDNIGIGHEALRTVTGSSNIAIGSNALRDTNSSNNVAIGDNSLWQNDTGTSNTALGYATLRDNDTGSNNTAIGGLAGRLNVSGNNNAYIGYQSGYSSTGNNNVFLGYQSGFNETGNDKLYIENSNADADNALIYGEFDNDILRTNGQLQIGNPSSTGYAFPTLDGTAGQVMTTDGSGNISFQDIAGDGNTQNTLNQAYNEGGAGAGRGINAVDGAVEINGEDGFQVVGTYGAGDVILLSGAGTRMFFNPRKAAFRAGRVSGNEWNNANIGNYSFAVGENNTASDISSTAFGRSNNVSGIASMASGSSNTVSGGDSFTFGQDNDVAGHRSGAFGSQNSTTGTDAFTFGSGNNAPSLGETTIGLYATTYSGSSSTFNSSDRVFSIGIGTGPTNRANALTVYKNGLINVNDAYDLPSSDGTNGQVLTTDGSGNTSWTNLPSASLSLARITMSADQSFTTSTWQKLNFDTVDFDLNSEFNTATDEFDVATTGYYRINASWRSTNTSTSTSAFGIAIVVNGVFEGAVNFNNSGSGYVFRSINRVMNLNAGDSIEIQILNTGPIDVFSNDIVTSFEIEQIR